MIYRIANSRAVNETFLRVAAEASATGQRSEFLRAARWIVEELERTPDEFGESRNAYPKLGLLGRAGQVGPLFVEYAFSETERIVYIRRVVLAKRS